MKVLDWGDDGYATAAETTALRASFEQEVAVWQKLDHPNVTKVYCFSLFITPNSQKEQASKQALKLEC